jgi:hypothetical protein
MFLGDKSWVAGVELATASEPPARQPRIWGRRFGTCDTLLNCVVPRGSSTTTGSEATMGKQVNFYMTADDEREFVEFVRSSANVAIFKSVQASPEIRELEEMPPAGEPFWFALYLWNKDDSPPPTLAYIKEQGWYSVDRFESEVIEFHRCSVDEGRLVRGRIWAEMNGWRRDDPATIIKKSEVFVKWYDRLANWIKRRSTRNAVGDFMLPGAAAFAAKGGQCRQTVLASGKAI